MAVNVGTLLVKMAVDKSQLIKGFADGEKAAESSAQKISRSFAKIGGNLTKFVTLPLGIAAVGMIKMGATLVETIGKTDVVFGAASKSVKAWGKTTLATFGLAEETALTMTAKFGDMGTSIGLSQQAMAEMGKEITGRVADLASFKDISTDIADTALTAIFTGETESLKQLGVVMTQTNLQQFALTQGITKSIKEMTEAEKVQLRFAFVMERTANAAGDFARTSESVANQMRTAKEQVKQLAANFGMLLQPMAAKALKAINGMLEGFNNMTPQGQKTILIIGGIAASIGPLLLGASKMITAFTAIKGVVVPAIAALGATSAGAGVAAGAGAAGMGAFGAAVLAVAAPVLIVVAAVGAAVLIYRAFTKEARDVEKANNEIRDSFVETSEVFTDNLTSIQATTSENKKLADELFKLSRIEHKTAGEKGRMQQIVSILNTSIMGLNLSINEETGLLSKNETAVTKLINTQKKQDQVLAVEKRQADVQTQRIALQDRINTLNDKYGEGTKKAVKFTEDLNRQLGNLNNQYEATNEFLQENTEFTAENVAARQDAAERAAEQAREEADALEVRKEAQLKFNEDVQAATEDHFDAMGSIYDDGVEQEKISLDKAVSNLEKQVEQYQKWQDDLATIASRVSPAIMEHLQDLGVEGGLLIAELAKATDEELNEFVSIMEEKAKLAKEAAIAEISGTTIGIVQELEKTEDVKTAAVELGEQIPTSLIVGLENKKDVITAGFESTGIHMIDVLVSTLADNAFKAYDMAGIIATRIASVMQNAFDIGQANLLTQSQIGVNDIAQNTSSRNSSVSVNHSGTITVNGVNNEGELTASFQATSDDLISQQQFDTRMVLG